MADKDRINEETTGFKELVDPPEEKDGDPQVQPVDSEDQSSTSDGGQDAPDAAAKRGRRSPKSRKKAPKAKKLEIKEVLSRLADKNQIITKLDRALNEKDKQLKDLNDKWLRSVAEFENYRKRSRKEWELLKQQSKTEVILEILNIVDDFERAFSVAEDSDSKEFVHGIKLIYNNLTQVLEKFGVKEIEAHHAPFDPNFHMAISQIETADVKSGLIAEVIQKGYQLDDSVIRPVKVIVAK